MEHNIQSYFNSSLNRFSFVAAVNSCARSRNLPLGRQLHAFITKSNNYHFINLRNVLIHMYSACGDLLSAHQLFDEMPLSTDSVSWSTLINGYSRLRRPDMVFGLFREMRRRRRNSTSSRVEVNETAVVSLLSLSMSQQGKCVHGFCIKYGMCAHLNVATAIVTMYLKCEALEEAKRAFEETSINIGKDVVLYNCMVVGYAKSGSLEESLGLLQRMKDEGMRMNSSSLVGLLAACASAGALPAGRRVHEIARQENLHLDTSLGTAILDMYVKCGCISEALQVFTQMQERDVMAWTAMIMGLGIHGRAGEAHRMFEEMEGLGVRPNEVTFLAVLNACSHGGMVSSGKDLFRKMVSEYGMRPGVKHYGCVIDLLGRAGMLEEAHEFISSMPLLERDATAWRALLSACRVHGNIRLGNVAQTALVELGDRHPTDSILLTSTYALSGKWTDVGRMRELEARESKKMSKKEAGYSSIDTMDQHFQQSDQSSRHS